MWRISPGLPVGHDLFLPNGFSQMGFAEKGAESWVKSSNGQSDPKGSVQHGTCQSPKNGQRFWQICGLRLVQRQVEVSDLFLPIQWTRRKKRSNPISFGGYLPQRQRPGEKVRVAALGIAFGSSVFVDRRKSRTFETLETSNKPTQHPPGEEGQRPQPHQ